MFLSAVVALSLCFVSVRPVVAALTIHGYTPATAGMYDRFDNDLDFIGSDRLVRRWADGRWSLGCFDQPFLCTQARSLSPTPGDTIRFYAAQ
ncbi:MAG: hypothetical protein R3C56_22010 [Pirellulaceae bacterium]